MKLKLMVFILFSLLSLWWFFNQSSPQPISQPTISTTEKLPIILSPTPSEIKSNPKNDLLVKPKKLELLPSIPHVKDPTNNVESLEKLPITANQLAVCNVKNIFDCEFCLGKPLSKCMYEKSRIMTTSLEKFYYLHKEKFNNQAVIEELIDVLWKKNQAIDSLGIQDPFTPEESAALDSKGKILDEEMARVNEIIQKEDPSGTIENLMKPSQKELTCMAIKNDCLGESSPLMEEEIQELLQKKWIVP